MSSGMRMTQEQYEELMRKRSMEPVVRLCGPRKGTVSELSGPVEPKKPPKYRNTRTTVDGKKFDSKLEARYYKLLQMQWQSTQNKLSQGIAPRPSSPHRPGDLLWFVRQVSIELQGGVRYRLDFQAVRMGCSPCCQHIELVDCKGVLTQVSANKIKQAESLLGVKIILANESDVKGITV